MPTRLEKARLFALMLGALLIALALAACGDDSPSGEAATGGASGAPEVVQSGFLTIGTDFAYPPFDYLDGGQPAGFDVDLLRAIAGRLGLEVKFVKTNFDTIFTSVAANRFDAAASGIAITPEREQVVDFTIPYFQTRIALVVNERETPSVRSVDDLEAGMTVGTQTGSSNLVWAKENLAPKGVEIRTYATFPAAYLDLEAGRLDGVVDDAAATASQMKNRPALALADTVPVPGTYGFALSPDAPGLKREMDAAIRELFEDGTFAQLYRKHIPELDVPGQLPPS